MRITPIILCGGEGSRLWPSSRSNTPKHFLRLSSHLSLFQESLQRLEDKRFNDPIIISSSETEYLLKEQLREINFEKAKIILEPVKRSTSASICLGALYAFKKDKNSKILVISADLKIENFDELVKDCFNAESIIKKSFVVFGKTPSFASSDFGYIESSSKLVDNFFNVNSFQEKPDNQTAQNYIDSEGYLWNLGIFLFSAENFIIAMKEHQNEILNICSSSLSIDDKDNILVDENIFSKSPSISIDYALMENIKNIVVCKTAIEWNDLGSWNALKELQTSFEDSYYENSNNIYIKNINGKKYVLKDISDINIIDESDVLMITNSNTTNKELSSFFDNAKKHFPSLKSFDQIDHRPWGMFKVLVDNRDYKIKYLEVLPFQKLSLQKHKYRSEHWTILEGEPNVTVNDSVKSHKANDHIFIKAGDIHRIENPTNKKVSFIEVQIGSYFGEDDIERLEDDYGRLDNNK